MEISSEWCGCWQLIWLLVAGIVGAAVFWKRVSYMYLVLVYMYVPLAKVFHDLSIVYSDMRPVQNVVYIHNYECFLESISVVHSLLTSRTGFNNNFDCYNWVYFAFIVATCKLDQLWTDLHGGCLIICKHSIKFQLNFFYRWPLTSGGAALSRKPRPNCHSN